MKISKYAIVNTETEPKKLFAHSNYIDEIDKILMEPDAPKEYYILDLHKKKCIADEVNGYYEKETFFDDSCEGITG